MAKQGPLSGQVLGGKYLVGELLGEGGFGMVYAGQHLLLDRPQAIKVLLERYFSRPKFRERFLREARLVAALDHLHIVHIDDFGIEEQAARAYLVMPFIDGGTLQDVLKKRRKPLEMEQVVSSIEQVASALDYAHQRGVVHLDLKPQNLLVHADGRLLLADFGLAHLLKQEVVEGGTSLRYGTPHYMAPEHINGQPEKRSDVYALGVILYQMLVGRRPFEGATPEAVIVKHLTERPPPLQVLRPELPLELEEVVEKALAKQAAQRYQSAGELVVALKGALATARERERKALEEERRKAEEERERKAEEERERKALEEERRKAEEERERKAQEEEARKVQEEEKPPFLSRRAVIMGIGGVVGLATVGGSLVWLARIQSSSAPAAQASPTVPPTSPSTPTPTPSPTPLSVGTTLYTYRGHSNWVNAVAWSPDSSRIASAGADQTVQVWDAADGGHVFTYRGHSSGVEAVAWSPDGKRIVSASSDKTVQVWNASNGGNVYTYRGHTNYVRVVAWSPDGKRIASGSADQTVQVWDAADGGNAFTYHGHSYDATDDVFAVAWSPDGKRIASGGNDKTVQVWDAADGGHVFTYRGHRAAVQAVVWSPDGKRIASGGNDQTVQVWDAADGGHVYTYPYYIYHGYADYVNTVAWSPDGKRIASGSADNTVQVWDAVDGGNVFTYRGHSQGVLAVAWSPDGKRIASGCWDHTVQVWLAG